MKTGPNGIALIEYYEGCELEAYPDPKTGGDPWTIGVGATGPGIVRGTVWTKAQADARLAADLYIREGDANNAILVEVSQGMFDAFMSILFNVGHGSPVKDGIIRLKSAYPSTLLRKLNAKDYAGACEEFAKWTSPGSSVSHGLRKRRRAEQALWNGLNAAQAIIIGNGTP